MHCSPPDSSARGIFQARNTGVDCRFLLQRIIPTQGSNLRLLHWGGCILYRCATWEALKIRVCLLKEDAILCGSVGVSGDFKQRRGVLRFDFRVRILVQIKKLWPRRHQDHFGWQNNNTDERE